MQIDKSTGNDGLSKEFHETCCTMIQKKPLYQLLKRLWDKITKLLSRGRSYKANREKKQI